VKKKIKNKTKSKPTYWDKLIAKSKPARNVTSVAGGPRKARPKHKAARKPQPKVTTMPKKTKAEQTELADETQAAPLTEEQLPPPDPPVVPSEPTEPPAPDAVDDSEKGAHPEVAAIRELNLTPEGTPGEGPVPGPPTTVEPQEEK
jgi:hypothetical protein